MFEHLRKVTDGDELDGLLTSSSTSYRSGLLASGMSTVEMPSRKAAMLFSFRPPMGRTLPCRVISPVMARSWRTGISDNAEISAVVRVTPAEGPSFGTAPSGHGYGYRCS